MKVVGLVSGGKDSCYNLMECVKHGHDIVCLANLYPSGADEIDSYMYQSVGHNGVQLYGEALGIPLYRRAIGGKPLNIGADYEITQDDEVEDLYQLMCTVKANHRDITGVSVGAILSSYQKQRVENVCRRLNLTPLCYLWERNQEELLDEMINAGINAIIIKVAALGLDENHVGKSLSEMRDHLNQLSTKYGVHVCGEGGEYETFVLDCPLFRNRIVIDQSNKVVHSPDQFAPVVYLSFSKLHLEPKNERGLSNTKEL